MLTATRFRFVPNNRHNAVSRLQLYIIGSGLPSWYGKPVTEQCDGRTRIPVSLLLRMQQTLIANATIMIHV